MGQAAALFSTFVTLCLAGVIAWLWIGPLRDTKEEMLATLKDEFSQGPSARIIEMRIRCDKRGGWLVSCPDLGILPANIPATNLRSAIPEMLAKSLQDPGVMVMPTDRPEFWVVVPS